MSCGAAAAVCVHYNMLHTSTSGAAQLPGGGMLVRQLQGMERGAGK